MISDATCELCASELDLLKQVTSLCPVVTVVLTKIDIVPRWRKVAERNRARLAAAGLRVKVVPVSATVRLAAAKTGDQQLNEESGFGELVRTLSQDVLGNSDAIRRGTTAVLAAQATKQLIGPLSEALTEAPGGEQGRAQVQYRAAQHRLDELRRRTTRWQTMLSDEVADLISDVEYDLRDRTRKIVRAADEFFDAADPAKTWDDFEYWLRDALAETADVELRLARRAVRLGGGEDRPPGRAGRGRAGGARRPRACSTTSAASSRRGWRSSPSASSCSSACAAPTAACSCSVSRPRSPACR